MTPTVTPGADSATPVMHAARLSHVDVESLAGVLAQAARSGQPVRVAVDTHDGLKVAVGRGMWSAGFGTPQVAG